MKLSEKRTLCQKLIEERAPLEDARTKYFELTNQISKLQKEIKKAEDSAELSSIETKTEFQECDYPSMGCEGRYGRAVFDSQETAERLMAALRKNSSYYYAYVLEWSAPGVYVVKPEYKYDHDGDTIYTARFTRIVFD